MTYNGWKNYETWNVKLWIDNEYNDYQYWRGHARSAWGLRDEDLDPEEQSCNARQMLANELKEWVEENMPDVSGFYSDILRANLSEIDYYEIANAMLEDIDADDEGYIPHRQREEAAT